MTEHITDALVTDAMIRAGDKASGTAPDDITNEQWFARIYTAMRNAAPDGEELVERVAQILDGIDLTQTDDENGWWETSTGADFGASKLAEVLAAIGQQRLDTTPDAK